MCDLLPFWVVECKAYYLHLSNVFLQPCNGVLVTSSIVAHAFLHFSHLAHQRLVLKGER